MPTHTNALAMTYARSLFELASAAGGQAKITEVAGELEQIAEIARSDKAFDEFVSSPIIDKTLREASLTRIFQNRVTDLTLRFLLVLNDKGRLGHLESIAGGFDALVQERFGRIEVDVFTAAPLGRDQLGGLQKSIQTALGKEPVLHPYTEPAMIGGVKLRIGDQLIDGSIATRLRRMKRDLQQSTGRLRDQSSRFIAD
ncbi:MAG TPA: ATP synthase F1 subunit delta [Phycisphaerales bacterium]|nr:ATP synthase F1 subunit delta [Phycisphaerales bacterium]